MGTETAPGWVPKMRPAAAAAMELKMSPMAMVIAPAGWAQAKAPPAAGWVREMGPAVEETIRTATATATPATATATPATAQHLRWVRCQGCCCRHLCCCHCRHCCHCLGHCPERLSRAHVPAAAPSGALQPTRAGGGCRHPAGTGGVACWPCDPANVQASAPRHDQQKRL